MKDSVYNYNLNIDWKLINLISEIDRFDANWTSVERKEGQSLKELKNIATVKSHFGFYVEMTLPKLETKQETSKEI
jgi:cell division FtsZ-interacting protein ZapD